MKLLRSLAILVALAVSVPAFAATKSTVTSPNAGGSLVNTNIPSANGTNSVTDSTVSQYVIGGMQREVAASGAVAMTNANCQTLYSASNATATTITTPPSPPAGCEVEVILGQSGISSPLYFDFNGKILNAYGLGTHDSTTHQFISPKPYGRIRVGYDGTKWGIRYCEPVVCGAAFREHLPMAANGQVNLTWNPGPAVFKLLPFNGPGWVIANGYAHRVQSAGLKLAQANTTSSNLNYIYMNDCGHVAVTNLADNGSGHPRLTVGVAANCGLAGDQLQVYCYSLPLSMTPLALGTNRATRIDSTHIDLPDVTYVAGGATAGGCRPLALYASTSTPDQALDASGTVQEDSGNPAGSEVGYASIGAANAVNSTTSFFNSQINFTGAGKSGGDGTWTQAAAADLSDTITGSGSLVKATSPTLVTPTLGVATATSVKTTATTVAGLATCNSGAKGTRDFVTDANATTFLSTVAGGGANNVPVVCDGTNWVIGLLIRPANDNDLRHYG